MIKLSLSPDPFPPKMTEAQKQMIKGNYDRTEASIEGYKFMAKLRAEDLPLRDGSYVFLPVGRVLSVNIEYYTLKNLPQITSGSVDFIGSYLPGGTPIPSWAGAAGFGSAFVYTPENLYDDLKTIIKDYIKK